MEFMLEHYLDPRDVRCESGTNILTERDLNLLKIASFILVGATLSVGLEHMAYAARMTGVGDIIKTDAFTGNTIWLERLSFLGKWTQAIISIAGIVGVMLNAMQIVVTLLVTTQPEFWKKVDRVKADNGSNPLSYAIKNFGGFDTVKTKGFDIVLEIALSALPNLQRLSDVKEGEYKNFADYFIKSFPRICLTFLALSMMINNSLFQCYLVVVDAFGVVAERVVETDSEGWMNNLLDVGSSYSFSLGTSGEGFDEVQEDVASKMYAEFVKSTKNFDTTAKYNVASAIESYVQKEMDKESIGAKLLPKNADPTNFTSSDWKFVKVQVAYNKIAASNNDVKVPASTFGIKDEAGEPSYFHVYFTYKPKLKDDTFYYTPLD